MSIKICLDAGHDGKYNRSPVVPEYYESDFNWKLHLKLKKELESWGIEVVTTRATQNEAMGLQTRGKKSKGCNAFLSLHANAADRETADHVVIYEMVNRKSHNLATLLAQTIQNTMKPVEKFDVRTKVNNNGGEWYTVLAGCAQVGNENGFIVEHSFYTNQAMAEWMMNESNLDKLAIEEARVIAEYYGVEKTNTPIEPTVKIVAGDLVSITTNAVYYTGQNVPNWVKQKNWYVSKVTSDFCVVDKSEDGTNAICSPIEEKYLVKIVKVAEPEPVPTPEPTPEPVDPPVETKPEPIPEVEFTPALAPEEQPKSEQNEAPARNEKKTKSILQLIIEIIKAIVGIFGK